jgi:hydrogenase expression/formation protein HypD
MVNWEYAPIAQQYGVPITVTGFEPLDIVQGILMTLRMLEHGRIGVENAYPRVVTFEGNQQAQAVINQVFMGCDQKWRGIGVITGSGWRLRPEFRMYDAEARFSVEAIKPDESPLCIAGLILQGLKKPHQCTAFGTACTPEKPLGATMVSSEGACAAYYRYSQDIVESRQ